MQTLEVTEEQLNTFLAGEPVTLHFADEDGSGEITWSDEAAEEFEPEEISALHYEGMAFWVHHPVTNKQVPVTVRVACQKSIAA